LVSTQASKAMSRDKRARGAHRGMQAVKAFAADDGIGTPEAQRPVAFYAGGEDRRREIGK